MNWRGAGWSGTRNGLELREDDLGGLALLTLRKLLTHTGDHLQAHAQALGDLGANQLHPGDIIRQSSDLMHTSSHLRGQSYLIALLEDAPPLGVAQDDPREAKVLHHRSAAHRPCACESTTQTRTEQVCLRT